MDTTRLPWTQSFLNGAAIFWFSITALGQWIFVIYILGLYVISGLQGDFESWNQVLPHGYEEGNGLANANLGAHLFLAAIISFLGPLQLIPQIRSRFPYLHRWSGRVYLLIALVMSLSGLYLSWSRRDVVGDLSQYIAISLNGLFILAFGILALRYALARNFVVHRRWALRLFLAVSGVWLFRVGLMFWLVVHGKPVGFDVESFSGPFLTFLAFGVYVFPVVILEIYLQVKEKGSGLVTALTAIGLCMLTLCMAVGIFGAVMGMWMPRLG